MTLEKSFGPVIQGVVILRRQKNMTSGSKLQRDSLEERLIFDEMLEQIFRENEVKPALDLQTFGISLAEMHPLAKIFSRGCVTQNRQGVGVPVDSPYLGSLSGHPQSKLSASATVLQHALAPPIIRG
jgi:hypothetical protein